MKKRIISLLLCIALLLSAASVIALPSFAATSGKTGDCTWTLNGTALTISGNGVMADYDTIFMQPWGDDITSVIIKNGVTHIGSCAFYGCKKLAKISISDSVSSIGNWAFIDTAYYDNYSNWQSRVLYIGHHLIVALDTISGTYSIQSGTKTIADGAFEDCSKITNIKIPNSVTNIGKNSFGSGLVSISLPNSIVCIGAETFRGCSSLKKIDIPESIKCIEEYAFWHCYSLNDVYYSGNKSQWEKIMVYGGNSDLISATIHYGKADFGDFIDIKSSDWYYTAVKYVFNKGLFSGVSNVLFAPNDNMTRAMFVTVLGRLYGAKVDDNVKTKFTDVKKGQWYTGYVKWASDKGIVSGVSATKFAPNANVTREQICKMMVEYCNVKKVKLRSVANPVNFADANKISKWAKEYVKTCQTSGLISGTKVKGKVYFNPKNYATRAQVAQILYNFSKTYLN